MIDYSRSTFTKCKFWPHIGADYGKTRPRLLILGESHYDPIEEKDQWQHTRLGYGADGTPVWRYGRLLKNRLEPWRPNLWTGCAHYNYVQHYCTGARNRPQAWMWCSPETVKGFLEVLSELEPELVLVTGKALWMQMVGAPPHLSGVRPERRFQVPHQFAGDNVAANTAFWYPTRETSVALAVPIYHPAYPKGFHSKGTTAVLEGLFSGDWRATV